MAWVATPPAAMATAAAVALFRLGHVDTDGAAVEVGPVEGRDGLVRSLVLFKGDEAEAARTAGVAIADHDGLFDLTMGGKCVAQGIVDGLL